MEKSILEMIKQDISDMNKAVDGDCSEILELEKDLKVQRYIYLKKLMESDELRAYGKNSILGIIISKYGQGAINESNNIWCRLFESDAKAIREVFFPGIFLDDNVRDDQVIVVYRDLENSERINFITKDKQEEFEATHKVVFGKTSIIDPSDRYYNTKHKFFSDCVDYGQEEAVKKALSLHTNAK